MEYEIQKLHNVRIMTKYHPKLIDSDRATAIFEYLKNNIAWIDGINSYNGFTRKAKPMTLGENDIVDTIIAETFQLLGMKEIVLYGIYLNYYRNGEDYTPSHCHKGMKQLIISLGSTRTLIVGNKSYNMSNGDVIIFGSSMHGIPKDHNCNDARISIALFLNKLSL